MKSLVNWIAAFAAYLMFRYLGPAIGSWVTFVFCAVTALFLLVAALSLNTDVRNLLREQWRMLAAAVGFMLAAALVLHGPLGWALGGTIGALLVLAYAVGYLASSGNAFTKARQKGVPANTQEKVWYLLEEIPTSPKPLDAFVIELGNRLRSTTFPDEDEECYGNFIIRPDAKKWDEKKINDFVFTHVRVGEDYKSEVVRLGRGYTYNVGTIQVEVFWWWDGDGTLMFRVTCPEGFVVMLENGDCKKNYTWKVLE